MQSSNPISDNIHRDLIGSVQGGRFLPFLGDGASSMRVLEHPGWKKVQRRAQRIFADLDEQQDPEVKEAEKRYLRSLVVAYELGYEEDNENGNEALSDESERADSIDYLHELRVALVKVGTEMVGVFGRQMDYTRACVEDIYRYKVSIAGQQKTIELILSHLADALENLRLHIQNSQKKAGTRGEREAERYLEANTILTKLLILAHQIGANYIQERNDPDDIYANLRTQFRAQIELIRQSFEGLKQSDWLSLAELAWIEDLLWHTLRYDIPVYLNTTEMTFRLSLQANSDELRRIELVQMAELTDYRSPLEVVKDWLEYCERKGASESEFHRTMAATLVYLFENFKENQNKEPALHLPMAFTTNQDRALERGLRSLRKDYHVVFPVKRSRNNNTTQHWLFQTYQYSLDGYYRPSVLDCTAWTGEGSLRDLLKGPLIIKLHGSPLENIDENLEENTRQEHNIVLSESEYLRSTVIPEGSTFKYPGWIVEQLKAPGSWWFLGYSIDDWFIRLRIFQHLSYVMGDPPASARVVRLALDYDFDPFRSVVLDRLNIKRSTTALTKVQAILYSMPEIEAILSKGMNK